MGPGFGPRLSVISPSSAVRGLLVALGTAGMLWTARPGEVDAAGSAVQDDIRGVIAREFPGFRIAQAADYIAILHKLDRRGEAVLREDFNQDGRPDLAVMVINGRQREYRVYFFTAGPRGYGFHQLFTRSWGDRSAARPIRTPMFLKQPGDPGISGRMYHTLVPFDVGRLVLTRTPAEAAEVRRLHEHYRSVPAIEVWNGQTHDERDDDLEDLAYCSRTWYFEKSQLKTFDACD